MPPPGPEKQAEVNAEDCPICVRRWSEDQDFRCLMCSRPLAVVPREDTEKLAKVKEEIERLKREALEHTNAAYAIRMGGSLLRFIAGLDKEAPNAEVQGGDQPE